MGSEHGQVAHDGAEAGQRLRSAQLEATGAGYPLHVEHGATMGQGVADDDLGGTGDVVVAGGRNRQRALFDGGDARVGIGTADNPGTGAGLGQAARTGNVEGNPAVTRTGEREETAIVADDIAEIAIVQ